MQKIKNIEFLRIVGCVAVICYHFCTLKTFEDLNTLANYGRYAVDLFFIIAGFFFILTFKKEVPLFNFLKKKVARLWPVLTFTIFLYWLFSLIHLSRFSFHQTIFTFLGLNGTILVLSRGMVGAFWYVSAMILVMGFLYYALRAFDKRHVNFFLALLIFFCYGGLVHFKGGVWPSMTDCYGWFFQVGTMRAIAGIGVGYFIGEWYKNNIKNVKRARLNICETLFVTLVEFLCVYFIINNLLFYNMKHENKLLFVVVFAIAILLFLAKKGFISRLLENDIMPLIARYSYSIYIVHCFILSVLNKAIYSKHPVFVSNHFWICFGVFFVISVVVGVLMYHFVEVPGYRMLKKKWRI